jgi:hypothetical protein
VVDDAIRRGRTIMTARQEREARRFVSFFSRAHRIAVSEI